MTSEQIEAVRTSFAKIEPVVEEAAVLFYARLFERDPDLRRLFTTDIREQGLKLMQMIALAVESLDRIEELTPLLQELGSRHVHYGVKDEHYDAVGDALLWMLRKALKEEYTREIHEAWTAIYGLLAEKMKGPAKPSLESASLI